MKQLLLETQNTESERGSDLLKAICGMTIAGIGAKMIVLAFIDPEPTSSLLSLILGGTIIITASLIALFTALGQQISVKVAMP